MQLPFPILSSETKNELENSIDRILIKENSEAINKIDKLIYKIFNLRKEEIQYIKILYDNIIKNGEKYG